MDGILNLDQSLFLYLNNLGARNFDHFWLLISNKWIWIPLYCIFLFILVKNFKLKSLIYILLFIAIAITVSDQVAGIFKDGFQRLRPCHDPHIMALMRSVDCGGMYGFYSSHASNSFLLATFLTFLLKKRYGWFPYFLFIWAAVVSYSRIYLGVHFPGDIAMGAVAGSIIGYVFYILTAKAIRNH